MTVEAIKEAIAELPEDERHSLAAWLNEMEYDDWDKEMVTDFSPGGRGMAWAEKVKREIAAGGALPIEEGRELRTYPESCARHPKVRPRSIQEVHGLGTLCETPCEAAAGRNAGRPYFSRSAKAGASWA